MAFSFFQKYLKAPGDNSNPAPDGMPEGMPPADYNDSGRQMMAAIYESYTWVTKLMLNDPATATTPEDPTSLPAQVFALGDQATDGDIVMTKTDQTITGVKTFNGVGRATTTIIMQDELPDLGFQVDGGNVGYMGYTGDRFIVDHPTSFKAKDGFTGLEVLWPTAETKMVSTGHTGTEATDEVAALVVSGSDASFGGLSMTYYLATNTAALVPYKAGAPLEAKSLWFDLADDVETWNMGADFVMTGKLTGTEAEFSGALTGTEAEFLGALTGTTAAFTGDVTSEATASSNWVNATTSISTPRYQVLDENGVTLRGAVQYLAGNGLNISETTLGNGLVLGFNIAGSVRGAAFASNRSVAVGNGFHCRTGRDGGWTTDLMNFHYSGAYPNVAMWVNAVNFGNVEITTSDERLKTINTSAPALDTGAMIDAIETIQFTWIRDDGNTPQYGLSAQNLHAVNPLLASGTPGGDVDADPMGYEVGASIAMLIDEVKSLRQRVKDLEG